MVHSAAQPAGEFACSNDLFNRIHTLVRWAQRSNMMSVLTDCPHREKLGWLEQYHLNGPSLRYEFDLAPLYTKGMNDMADSQLANGLCRDIAPEYVASSRGGFRDSPEWGSAFILVPWQQYEFDGDRELFAPALRGDAALRRPISAAGRRSTSSITAWATGTTSALGRPAMAQLTPDGAHGHGVLLAKTCRRWPRSPALLGKADDAGEYERAGRRDSRRVQREVLQSAAGQYATGSQAANAMPLVMGLVEPAQRAGGAGGDRGRTSRAATP